MKRIAIYIVGKMLQFTTWVNDECLKDGKVTEGEYQLNNAKLLALRLDFKKVLHRKPDVRAFAFDPENQLICEYDGCWRTDTQMYQRLRSDIGGEVEGEEDIKDWLTEPFSLCPEHSKGREPLP